MNVGILVIGDELTSGMTQDTNSSFAARELYVQWWRVSAVMTVGDDVSAIRGGLDYLLGISDALVVMGGLGPTADDITTACVAKAFGLGLYTDDTVLKQLKERFAKIHIPWTENNAKQALFPDGAVVIDNPAGTACGFFLERSGIPVTVMPGVPVEARNMLLEGVIPLFREKLGSRERVAKRAINIFRLSESKIDQELARENLNIPGVSIGFYPRFPQISVVVTSRGEDAARVEENLTRAEKKITNRLGHYIFGYDDDTMEGVVAALLTDRGLTLAVAESCTGGLIIDRLTDVPGSSLFLERGVVVYSNASKVDLLGVPASIIDKHGAVSEETAVLMAEGVRRLGGTDIGLATTGIAGPAGGTEEKPVGTVFVALSSGEGTICRRYQFRWKRRRIKEISAQIALDMLRRALTGGDILA
ncbi:MAG: CinA family nicotinamide mononucleotide deamidase-related protein [Syntrophales bacterium]|nr:CinA family nicotinamide mononucleotide deamidase-related protein [Syntrophales bacterium]